MKKLLFFGAVTVLLFVQCGNDKDPFIIKEGAVGELTKDIRMRQVDSIYVNDSIVKLNPTENALGTQGEVEIYDKDGKKLLLLSPEDENDPEAMITTVQVFDDRFKTEKGLTPSSTFKDIKDKYTIASIETTINAVVIFLKDSDIFITIDKKELPENLRYDPNVKIEATQIPDTAKFKYFMIGWDRD